jgi:hypothetical protein
MEREEGGGRRKEGRRREKEGGREEGMRENEGEGETSPSFV